MACQELYHSLGIMGRHLNGRPLCHPAGQDIPGQGSTQFAICSCHLPQTSSLNSLGDCKAQLPPDPRVIGYGALVVTKGKRAFSIDHFSTARLQWLSQAWDKLMGEEKTPVHVAAAAAATLEIIFPVHFFLHSHIRRTGLPPAGTRRLFCGFIFTFFHFLQGSYIVYHSVWRKTMLRDHLYYFNLYFCTWPVLDIFQS